MKTPLALAAFGAALAAPVQSDATLMSLDLYAYGNPNTCVLSATDRTGAWDCHPESRPENQATASEVLRSVRLRLEWCDGVKVDSDEYPNPTDLRLETFATGPGVSGCVDQAVEEVNAGLQNAGRFAVEAEPDADRFRVIVSE